jgi:phosphatidate cytidylyltransferase
MLTQRLISAAIGIPIILAVIYVGDEPYTGVVAIILAIAAIEFVHMADGESKPLWQPSPVGLVAAVSVAAIAIEASDGYDEWMAAVAASVVAAFLYIIVLRRIPSALGDWATIVAAVLYIGWLGSFFIFVRDLDDHGYWVYWAVLSTWGTDTCAYAVGKLWGRHKMAPSISPGKTWEGTAGAIGGGLVAVAVLGMLLDLPVEWWEAALLGLMLPAVAVLADLGESVLKRGAGVKDTSELVPGHGGLLDRLDSLLFTVPLVYYFAVWVVL